MSGSSLREYLKQRRQELIESIAPLREEIAERQSLLAGLEGELADVEKSAAAIGMVNGVQTESEDDQHPSFKKGTIKDYAVQVLSDHPGGLIALDILSKINSRYGTNFPRTSLSPQLSRLRSEGIISRRGTVWFIVDKNKGSEVSSEPYAGDVAERFNAPDSKSGEAGSSKNMTASEGSNPSVSATFHRVKEDLLSGVSLFGASTAPSFPVGKKGG